MIGKLLHLFDYFAFTILSTFAVSAICSVVIYVVILSQALSTSSVHRSPWKCRACYLVMFGNRYS